MFNRATSLLLCGLDTLFSLQLFLWQNANQFQITISDFRTISCLASEPKTVVLFLYSHSKQESWHRVHTNSLLLVLWTCQTAFLLFRSHLTRQMEHRGELWLDWLKTAGGLKRKMPRWWGRRRGECGGDSLTLELFLRTMSRMTMARSSSFSCGGGGEREAGWRRPSLWLRASQQVTWAAA